MGRAPCCSKVGLHRGPWTSREDDLLIKYIEVHGEGQWRSMPKKAGLLRCGKSCRLRWMNYLRPDIKRGNITPDEDDLIIRLHALLGNRWSIIAGRLPGRTDNEIKNYWNTHLSKRLLSQGTDPNTHKKLSESELKNLAKNSNNKRCTKSSTCTKRRKLDEQGTNKDDVGQVGEKTKIHSPKPIRVRPVCSLTRDNSNKSLESNNNLSNNTSISSSSQTQTRTQTQNQTLIQTHMLNMPWVPSYSTSMENNVFDDYHHGMMMTIGSSSSCGDSKVNIDFMQPHNEEVIAPDHYSTTNQQFEKLYEEYLQLIKVDHENHYHDDDDDNDNDNDDGDGVGEAQLDSFTESFFI